MGTYSLKFRNSLPRKGKVCFLLLFQSCLFSNVVSQFAVNRFLNNTTLFPLTQPSLNPNVVINNRVLDDAVGYTVGWEANRDTNLIVFNISAVTSGSLSFGLSTNGQVARADVIVVGLPTNGQPFLIDTYGSSNNTISRDSKQDWRLLAAQTVQGRVTLSVSRRFDTCDEQEDIVINNDMVHLIWGYGDNLNSSITSFQFDPKGSRRVYLLDPVVPTLANLQTWRVSRRFQIPRRNTSYWCTIHRGPSLKSKHHIVGYSAYFQNEYARNRVHHQLVYRCTPPPGIDASVVFERFVSHPGEECYLEAQHQLPSLWCTEMIHIYGVGGEGFQFPQNIGFPLGETANEYFMLETHYDSTPNDYGQIIETGADFQYTPHLRPTEGGMMFVGYGVLGMFMVPPKVANFTIMGQCSSECTGRMFPSGVEVVATMLHAHMATRRVRMKHYRGNRELPWVQNDDNYDFSFQQVRVLPKPVTVLPGDQLTSECVMDTRSRNTTTLAGFSSSDEMCVTFVMVNRRIPYLFCSSERHTERYMSRFGIHNMTWDRTRQERIVNSADSPSFIGRAFADVVDSNIEWTPDRIQALEYDQLFNSHTAICPDLQRAGLLAYLSVFIEGLTLGVISQREQIENSRPTTRSISTPPRGNQNVTFSDRAEVYIPPAFTCQA